MRKHALLIAVALLCSCSSNACETNLSHSRKICEAKIAAAAELCKTKDDCEPLKTLLAEKCARR